jgi:hypothetical protein
MVSSSPLVVYMYIYIYIYMSLWMFLFFTSIYVSLWMLRTLCRFDSQIPRPHVCCGDRPCGDFDGLFFLELVLNI